MGERAGRAEARARRSAGLHKEHPDSRGRPEGRHPPGQRVRGGGGRDRPARHLQVRKAGHGHPGAEMGPRKMHPVQLVLLLLPPRGDPPVPADGRRETRRAEDVRHGGGQGPGAGGAFLPRPDRPAGLHRLRLLRAGVPRARQGPGDGPAGDAAPAAGQLGLFARPAAEEEPARQILGEGQPVRAAAS